MRGEPVPQAVALGHGIAVVAQKHVHFADLHLRRQREVAHHIGLCARGVAERTQHRVATHRIGGLRDRGYQLIDRRLALLFHRHRQRGAQQVGVRGHEIRQSILAGLQRRFALLQQHATHGRHLELESQRTCQRTAHQYVVGRLAGAALIAERFEAWQVRLRHRFADRGFLRLGPGFVVVDPFNRIQRSQRDLAHLRRRQLAHRGQHFGRIHVTAMERRIDGIGKRQLLAVTALRDHPGERRAIGPGHFVAVIAIAIGVRHVPRRTLATVDLHARRFGIQHPALHAVWETHADRNAPQAVRITGRSQRQIAALRQFQHRGALRLAIQLGGDQRHAILV